MTPLVINPVVISPGGTPRTVKLGEAVQLLGVSVCGGLRQPPVDAEGLRLAHRAQQAREYRIRNADAINARRRARYAERQGGSS